MSFRVCSGCYYIYCFAADGLSSSTCSQNINVGPWESCWFARYYAGVWHCVILASLTEKSAKSKWVNRTKNKQTKSVSTWPKRMVRIRSIKVPLLIVKTGRGVRIGQPAPMLPPDHYGCGLGCKYLTGMLAAVEEHEHKCAHALERLLSEGLDCKILNSDEDELALTLLDIVETLQYHLSVLQKACRHALASPLLVASEEMPPLESADRHPAPSQKLPTSKQLTPPAAPASAPPLSYALIASSPLSLNLLSYTLPHSTQTVDSNLVANTTINSSRKEKVPQQQGQYISRGS